jgi:hypothetical protein
MKWMFLLFMMISTLFPNQADEPNYALPDVSTVFPLQWKAEIGAASYRTNPVYEGSSLYMGSNGKGFRDANLFDTKGGVYMLNRKTGKVVRQFANEVPGDMDVNGLLIHKGRIYFGNDNEEILCTDLSGKEIWRRPISGDIEAEPVLINTGKQNVIVFASEVGELQAVDPVNGNTVWAHYTPEFKGWKPGNSRVVMKVQAYFQNAQSFITKPVVAHLNGNGVPDLVYHTYDNRLYAVEGKTGQRIYSFNDENYILYTVVDIQKRKKGYVTRCILAEWQSGSQIRPLYLVEINTKGKITRKIKLLENSSFAIEKVLKRKNGDVLVPTINSVLVISASDSISFIDRKNLLPKELRSDVYTDHRSSYISRFASDIFKYGTHKHCIAIFNEHDPVNNGFSFIDIIDLDSKEVLANVKFPGDGEMPPYIGDVTGDGQPDMLYGGYDGLYCYKLSK